MAQRPPLVLHRQPGQPQLLALTGNNPVRILRLRCPHCTLQEPDKLEQRRPVVRHRTIRATAIDRREQVLIQQLLFEVLTFLAGRRTPRGIQRPDHGQSHDHPSSPNPTAGRQYREPVRNPDRLSNTAGSSACRTWPGPKTLRPQLALTELWGVPVGLADLIDDPDL